MEERRPTEKREAWSGAFFWLSAFYFVYCGRPTDWLPALDFIPLAKITSVFAMLSLLLSAGKTPRRFRDLPKEAIYLLLLVALLFASAFLSPVWRGGAFFNTLDFSKVYVAWVLTFLLVTTLKKLRRIMFLQSVSVVIISLVAVAKGHSVPRLSGVIGGVYSNPNDMAFAIVLSLPFCLAFFLSARNVFRKGIWGLAMLAMAVALILTASRAGFIDLLIAGAVCLWHFGVKGKRLYLIAVTVFLGAVLLLTAGKNLTKRFVAISGEDLNSQIEGNAYGSYEERKLLMSRALDAIEHYPILGVGAGNFIAYSGLWKVVHVSYLQIAADGGIPVLMLYLMFFFRGFSNLSRLRKFGNLDEETILFAGALKGSLVGFVVGACFAPEAYQFFPYFTVCYTSVIFAICKEKARSTSSIILTPLPQRRFAEIAGSEGGSGVLTPAL